MCKCDNLFELTDLHKAHQLTQQDVRNIQIVKEQILPKINFEEQNFIQQLIANNGGARRDRTADLLRARQALSQLSYGPDNMRFNNQLVVII